MTERHDDLELRHAARSSRARRRLGSTIALTAFALLAIGATALALTSRSDESQREVQDSLVGGDGVETSTPGGALSSGPEPESAVTPAPAESTVDPVVAPGCDELSLHASMAMWDSVLADQLVDNDCPFPPDSVEVSMEGGTEDLALAAPYEPRRYREIFEIASAEAFGVCAVGRIAEPSERGFVYGFNMEFSAGTCGDTKLAVREYASRGHRDEAAHTFALSDQSVLVLGRWALTLQSGDPAALQRLSTRLQTIGAVPVTA